MKKWSSTFLFLSLSDCNGALAIQNTMFHSFDNNIYRSQLSVKVTDIIQTIVDINSASNTATLGCVDHNGFTQPHGVHQSKHPVWLIVLERVLYNECDIYLKLRPKGSSSPDIEDNDSCYPTKGLAWDETNVSGRACFNIGKKRSLARSFGGITLDIRFSVDLPKGDYTFPVRFLRGIQRDNYDYIGGCYKIPSSLMKMFPFNGTLNFSVRNTGGRHPSTQSLEINRGDLSINGASNHYAAWTLSVSCDVPTNIRFLLLSNIVPAYSHG